MVIPFSPKNEFSLYFHIPFCKHKCAYCHFYVIPDKEEHKALLLRGLQIEWERVKEQLRDLRLTTIYFGGGTPALFGPDRIKTILDDIDTLFSFSKSQPEITLEANPENTTLELMRAYREAGINRISLGVQSLNETELQVLTRQHDAIKAKEAVQHVYDAGIFNISIDLMYDLPSQSLAHWKNTLDQVKDLPITHLSLYNLTIEPHTLFYKYKDKISKKVPDEETSLTMYLDAVDALETIGLRQYEISAFAKEGLYSKHNTGYWTGRNFLGLGPSAFGYWGGQRFKNIAHLNKYVDFMEAGLKASDFTDDLTTLERKRELFVIALRIIDGVDLLNFEKIYGELEQETLKILEDLIESNLINCSGSRYFLTQRGITLYDYVASKLI